MKKNNIQKGYTLFEVILVVVAISVGATIIFSAYDDQRQQARMEKEMTQLEKTIEIIDNFSYGSLLYQEPSFDWLNDSGQIPADFEYTPGTNTLNASWGSVSMDTQSSLGSGPQDLLALTFDGLSDDTCIQVLKNFATNSYETRVNGDLVGLSPSANENRVGRHQIRWGQAAGLCEDRNNEVEVLKLKPVELSNLLPKSPRLPSPAQEAEYIAQYNRMKAALAAREYRQLELGLGGDNLENLTNDPSCQSGYMTVFGCYSPGGNSGGGISPGGGTRTPTNPDVPVDPNPNDPRQINPPNCQQYPATAGC